MLEMVPPSLKAGNNAVTLFNLVIFRDPSELTKIPEGYWSVGVQEYWKKLEFRNSGIKELIKN